MKKLVFFTGAGVSQESGIPTFRDITDGLYMDHEIEEAVTKEGWMRKRELVLNFHNTLRRKIKDVFPNEAHTLIARLEGEYQVTVITQNIDDLHERGGSSTVYHLHGELLKSRSTLNHKIYDCADDINIGDKCPDGSQLRPHTVFFGEEPYFIQQAYEALSEADILVVVGTSLQIGYTVLLLGATSAKEIYYVDPEPSLELENRLNIFNKPKVNYIKKKAVAGMENLFKKLVK